eukprot:TRINITY_DN5085_c0_g1_i1.p1 TRINITY_DN5085_c0_g1~~TRINITY_DN5085_c0_g1_i1.p1  ORF type:complete len:753 (+),score=192.31 TRINITY_DN5085_c0_g1_i1:121-2379(+)
MVKFENYLHNHHDGLCMAVAWSKTGELLSVGDDKVVAKWTSDGELKDGKVTETKAHPVCIDTDAKSGDYVMGFNNGTFSTMTSLGRIERTVEAHKGAVICAKWAPDAASLATGGEDGAIKIYSNRGQIRSTLVQSGPPVYSLSWSPDGESLLYACGKDINVKPLKGNMKTLCWANAHDGTIMNVDWNPSTNLVVSCGEDCKYKVWDASGRCLYQSEPMAQIPMSVAWAPDGQMFAVGSYEQVRLCDKAGWIHYRAETPGSGSLFSLKWSLDGTQFAAGGGSGAVYFAQIFDREVEWANYRVVQAHGKLLEVRDVEAQTCHELDFRERVICMRINHGCLVVATTSQCFIYNITNLNTPHIFDTRAVIYHIALAQDKFLVVDNLRKVSVYSYDGRLICTPRIPPNVDTHHLNHHTISLSRDCLAVLDRSNSKTILVYNAKTGQPMGALIKHDHEIVSLALSLHGDHTADRMVAFVDNNKNLYISSIHKLNALQLSTSVSAFAFSAESDNLVALADKQVVTWHFPQGIFDDRDLMKSASTRVPADNIVGPVGIMSFYEEELWLRLSSGVKTQISISIPSVTLSQVIARQQWESALKLCRTFDKESLWSTLALMALHYNKLEPAEEALAMVGDIAKCYKISEIRQLPSQEARNAALAVYKRRPMEAERILLQANPPRIYRALRIHMDAHRWSRALDIAIKYKTHVDTVLAFRQQWLAPSGSEETDERFKQYSEQVTVDWDTINAKIQSEEENENLV